MLYFVNIVLKLEWPKNVWCYFDSSKVRGEGNSVIQCIKIFINQEIIPGPKDAHICFTFLTTTRDFSVQFKELFHW